MSHSKNRPQSVHRRGFLGRSLVAGAAGAMTGLDPGRPAAAAEPNPVKPAASGPTPGSRMPCGQIGKVRISRLLMGGNLISGHMHARDLKYVRSLTRAYVTEEKILETLRVAEEHGINTVFETGGDFVQRHNRQSGGHMQFIPHIAVEPDQDEQALKDHIRQQMDCGAAALYIWGVSGDKLVRAGQIGPLAKVVELAKAHGLPVGVGGHSLLVPMACEKHQVPCDFYVKTLHRDDYPSATPKELRKEFGWFGGAEGWYDNMWCINPEETVAFMQTVSKPWLAYKVLAAGALSPRNGFGYAFRSGADFIAVGMFDFQIKENCDLVGRLVEREQNRPRPWRA